MNKVLNKITEIDLKIKLKYIVFLAALIFILGITYYVPIKGNQITLSLTICVLIDGLLYFIYKKTNKEIYLFVLLISIIASIYYLPYLTNSNIFCFDNDHYTEYENFYKEWKRLIDNLITNKSLPFYSFNSFLGNDYFSSKSFHLTGDVLFPLFYLFPTINEGIIFQSYILTIIASIFMFLYLKEFGIKKKEVLYVGSFLFALGSLAMYYTSPIAWKRFYCFLPLLFYGIEKYRTKNKISLFTIAVALLLLTNYYNMFPTTLILPAYFIFTYSYHANEFKIITILKKSIKMIVAYIIGFLISGVVIIPTVYFMSSNPRVGTGISTDLFFNIRVYLGYIYSLITHYGITVAEFIFNMGDNGHLSIYSCYISSILIPCVFSFLFSKRKDKKNFYLKLLILFCFVITLNPTLNTIMHGFSQASLRQLFLSAFIFLLSFCIFFDEDVVDYLKFKKGLLLFTIIFAIGTIVGILLGIIKVSINNLTLISAIIAILINWIYLLLVKNRSYKFIFIIVCSITVVLNIRFLGLFNSEYKFYSDGLDREAMQYLQERDDDKFFRINIDDYTLAPYIEPLNLNQSLNYGYRGTSAYDSTYEGNLSEFLEMNGIKDSHILKITNPECLRMLSVKYFYVQSEDELPKQYNFKYVENNNNYEIYELEEYRPLGFTYSKFTQNKDVIINENAWNNILYINDELVNETNDINPSESIDFKVEEYYDDNNIKGTIENDTKQVLFFSIPYNTGWRVKDNGEVLQTYKTQGGFLAIILEPGSHYIELNFMPNGLKTGFIASAIGAVALCVISVYEKRKTSIQK